MGDSVFRVICESLIIVMERSLLVKTDASKFLFVADLPRVFSITNLSAFFADLSWFLPCPDLLFLPESDFRDSSESSLDQHGLLDVLGLLRVAPPQLSDALLEQPEELHYLVPLQHDAAN